MTQTNITEKTLKSKIGVTMLILLIAAILGVVMMVNYNMAGIALLVIGILGWLVFPILMAGLKVVKPNEALILTLFGKYYGTIKEPGMHYVHPFSVAFSPTYNAAKAAAAYKTQEAAKEGKSVIIPVNLSKSISLKTQTLDNRRQKVNITNPS